MIGQVVLARLAPDYMSAAVIGPTMPRNVVRMEVAVSGEERCVTTDAYETTIRSFQFQVSATQWRESEQRSPSPARNHQTVPVSAKHDPM